MIASLLSGKGGTGKSTLAANLAYAASRLTAKRVILVGADPASRSVEFLVEGRDLPEYGWIEYLTTPEMHFEEIVVQSSLTGNLFVAYSSRERILHGEFEDPNLVAEKISRFKGYIARTGDVVIIDCPAGLAVDHLLYALLFDSYVVTTPAGADLAGTKNFVFTIEREASQYGIAKPFKGVVVNMVRGRGEGEAVAEELALKLIAALPASPEVEKATAKRQLIAKAYPRSSFTQAIYELASKLGLGERHAKKMSLLDTLLNLWRR